MYKHTDELRIFSEQHSPHIICLNETKLSEEISDELLHMDGFQSIVRKDRNRRGGGVAAYVKNGIKFKTREDLNSDIESISIELDIKHVKPIIVTIIYRPPHSLVEWFDRAEKLVSETDSENKECILAGDMNCDMLKTRDNDTRHTKRIYGTYHFKRMITEVTRVTSDTRTLIDHIASNKSDRISSGGVISCGISDHDAVFVVRSMRIPKLPGNSRIVTVRKYKKFDLATFRRDLHGIQFDEIRSISSDPSEMWTVWKNLFLEVLNKHAPLDNIKIKGSNLPYITSEIRQLARQRDFLRKKANKTGSRYLRQAFQQIKHKVTYKIRQARSEYYSRRINENQGYIKGTWKVLKQAINKGPKMANINSVIYDSELVTDRNNIPEVFNGHFVGVGEKLAKDVSPSSCSSSDCILKVNTNGSRFEFKLLKPVDVYKVFSKLKNGKAAGMHLIPNRILKNVKDILTPSITDIFNASIKSKTFPDDFKIARVTPIFKGGNTEDLGNYRPISILASIARIFERLLYKQLHDFLATNKILNNGVLDHFIPLLWLSLTARRTDFLTSTKESLI